MVWEVGPIFLVFCLGISAKEIITGKWSECFVVLLFTALVDQKLPIEGHLYLYCLQSWTRPGGAEIGGSKFGSVPPLCFGQNPKFTDFVWTYSYCNVLPVWYEVCINCTSTLTLFIHYSSLSDSVLKPYITNLSILNSIQILLKLVISIP